MQRRKNLIPQGARFGKLVVICQDTSSRGRNNAYYLCRCDCGGGASIRGDHLKDGHSVTCTGCPPSPRAKSLSAEGARRRRGREAKAKRGHLMREYRLEYNSWQSMKQRCLNLRCKAYPMYGGAGINVCESWSRSFEQFLSDMGPRPTPQHTLDRIDGGGSYTPENCRWATPMEQVYNTVWVRPVEINGIVYPSVIGAARETGISESTIRRAIGIRLTEGRRIA